MAVQNRGTLRRRLYQRSKQMRGMAKTTAAAQEQAQRATFLLCAVLAQCGGSKTVTQGTLDQCMAASDKIGFGMQPGATAGEYELRLLMQDDTAVEAPSAPLTPIAPITITG